MTRPEIDERMPLEEVAARVCETLEQSGISVVLSGGAAVSIYSDNEFTSYDLDFISTGLARRVDDAMRSLGFERQQRHWVHPRSPYWVEFPQGPVAVGNETVHAFAQRETATGVLRLLHPTECVMDRLTWYIYNADPQCLEQAVRVAALHPVNLPRIRRWARAEAAGGLERFEEFGRRLEADLDQG